MKSERFSAPRRDVTDPNELFTASEQHSFSD